LRLSGSLQCSDCAIDIGAMIFNWVCYGRHDVRKASQMKDPVYTGENLRQVVGLSQIQLFYFKLRIEGHLCQIIELPTGEVI
jgi:hypothetical protein